jgi:hypothetical protein
MGAGAIAVTSALWHRDQQLLSLWMTNVSRDLNFTAAILDVLLWTILLASRRKDRLLLMISGGLGIKFAGAAVGHSILLLANKSQPIVLIGGLIVVLTYLVSLYVWWEAFRRESPPSDPATLAAGNQG